MLEKQYLCCVSKLYHTDEWENTMQTVTLLWEQCKVPSTWSRELSCGWLGQTDSLPVIWVYPEKDVSSERSLFLFAFLPFSPLFLFAFCGVCQWNWNLLDPHSCCGRSCLAIQTSLLERRNDFLMAFYLANTKMKRILSLLLLLWHLWLCCKHIPVVLLAWGCSLT